MSVPAIVVEGLERCYGAVEAVRDVSFAVERGEVFALLGPNGAGKTTTVEILEGYRHRDGGAVSVLGVDPAEGGTALRDRIGIVLQSSGVYPFTTAREVLELFAGYYSRPRRPDDVLALVGLDDIADRRVRGLSGGQRRRLDLALALIGDPELVFLDEPTTGFDPEARRDAWESLRGLARHGTTILLTTHYLDEAEALADRVAVLRHGIVVAQGSPRELAPAVPGVEVRFGLPDDISPPALAGLVLTRAGNRFEGRTTAPEQALRDLCAWAIETGVGLDGLEVRRPRLEDVYLELTAEAAGAA